MRWRWKIGRIAGIDVFVHMTFLILLVWVGVSHYLENRRAADAVSGIVFILTLFAIVILHELGHALAARRFGIRTRDITLLPIGGVARLERMPDDPLEELLVALAGPAVNVVLAVGIFVFLVPAAALAFMRDVHFAGTGFLVKLFWVNVVLAVFNLIPAFPMDGGRVLRALLALKIDYVRATTIAATIGQGLAFVFGIAGLFYNPFLVFIALFVWMGAAAESSMVQMRSALGGIPVGRAMVTDFKVLFPSNSLGKATEFILAGFQHDFPVIQDGRLVGVLTRSDLLKTIAERGPDVPVGEVMKTEFQTADPSEMLETALQRLRASSCPALPVLKGAYLVGILTLDNIGEFVAIRSALRHTPAAGGEKAPDTAGS